MSVRPRLPMLLVIAALAVGWAGAAHAVIRGSSLAIPLIVLGDKKPEYQLCQRAIDRSWGLSEDSVYKVVDVPEWRSEGLAAGLSAAIPGAGQLYAGERSGFWFALAEVAGWMANRIYVHRQQVERDRATRFVGDPADSASAWSFARWSATTGLDPARIAAIWAADRDAFYETIARDPVYAAGWSGAGAQTDYAAMRGKVQDLGNRAFLSGTMIWLNHLVAAFDALRAARNQNVYLQHNLELKLKSSWNRSGPGLTATLVKRF